MARTAGSRNADYDEQRLALARKVRELLVRPGGVSSSLREMAAAADTSVATLKHYFQDRDGILEAVLETIRIDGAQHLARAARPVQGDVRGSLLSFLQGLKEAWLKFGLGPVQSTALEAGLSSASLGPAYLHNVLEPMVQAVEQRLRAHEELGELRPLNERFAALQLVSPVFLGLLHQQSLCGHSVRPLDVEAFLVAHVDAFLAAHPPTTRGKRNSAASAPAAR